MYFPITKTEEKPNKKFPVLISQNMINKKQPRRRANSNYFLRKAKLKAIFALLHRCIVYGQFLFLGSALYKYYPGQLSPIFNESKSKPFDEMFLRFINLEHCKVVGPMFTIGTTLFYVENYHHNDLKFSLHLRAILDPN